MKSRLLHYVLAPTPEYKPGAEAAINDSLVLHIAFGGTSVLLAGDAEATVEQAMLGENGLESTLLKVGHHRSTTSTTPVRPWHALPHSGP